MDPAPVRRSTEEIHQPPSIESQTNNEG